MRLVIGIMGRTDKGCHQSTHLRLYDAMVLPAMDYGVAVAVTAITECITEMDKFKEQSC